MTPSLETLFHFFTNNFCLFKNTKFACFGHFFESHILMSFCAYEIKFVLLLFFYLMPIELLGQSKNLEVKKGIIFHCIPLYILMNNSWFLCVVPMHFLCVKLNKRSLGVCVCLCVWGLIVKLEIFQGEWIPSNFIAWNLMTFIFTADQVLFSSEEIVERPMNLNHNQQLEIEKLSRCQIYGGHRLEVIPFSCCRFRVSLHNFSVPCVFLHSPTGFSLCLL